LPRKTLPLSEVYRLLEPGPVVLLTTARNGRAFLILGHAKDSAFRETIQFLTFTGPFLAEPAKMWLLQKRGLSPKRAVAATVSEYLIYTLTSAAFAIAALIYLLGNFELSRLVALAAKILSTR